MFTQTERDRRLKNADEMMRSKGISLAILVGSGAVGPGSYGNYRYLTENRIYYYMQALILIQGREPIVCCGSPTHLDSLTSRGFRSVRICGDQIIEGVIAVLNEQKITKGVVGLCLDVMPTSWLDTLTAAFPEYTFVDLSQEFLDLRLSRSGEETAAARACARIADEGYQALMDVLHAGSQEQELAAGLDYALKKNGAEETFTLLTSGSDPCGSGGIELLHFAADSEKTVSSGGYIAAEITPRYEGYWTQLVRTICVGEASEELKRIHAVSVQVIEKAALMLKPGVRVGDVAECIFRHIKAAGYVPALPCGHICGIDLNEMRLEPDCDLLLRDEMTVILHPTITKAEGMAPSFYWGETYLVTPQGGQCLSNAGSQLKTV